MKKLLALCLLLVPALDARAGIALSRSLEWLADTSQSIGVYTAATVDGKPWNHNTLYSLGFKLKDPLKGKPPASLKFDDFSYDTKDLKVAPGDQFLVFLRADENTPLRPVQVISLAHPGGLRGSPEFLAMTAKFVLPADGAAVLRAVSDRMAAHPGTFPAQSGQSALPVTQSPSLDLKEIEWEYDGYVLMVPVDLQPDLVVRQDLEMIIDGLKGYYHLNHAMPSGDAAKIVKTLCDSGWLPGDVLKARANAAGEFLDPWGTPYRINVSNPLEPRAYSCGPDKKDDVDAPGTHDIVGR